MKRGKIYLIFILFVLNLTSQAQINQYGIPFIRNYSPKEYNAAEQNWTVVQDLRGVMYFGNNSQGVIEYDGSTWNTIPIPNQSIVRSLAIDSSGTVYVGAVEEFGYLAPDQRGVLKYISLSKNLDTAKYKIANTSIWKIYSNQTQVLFCSNTKIFIYQEKVLQKVVDLPRYSFWSFYINNELYTGNFDDGILVNRNGKIQQANGGSYFRDKNIFLMLPYSDNEILVGANDGLYFFNETNGIAEPFERTPMQKFVNNFVKPFVVYSGALLPDGNIAIGTIYGGLLIIDKSGKIINHFTKKSGLQDEAITYVFTGKGVNNTSTLWLGLNYGISNIELNSPIRKFDSESNLNINSFVLDICKFKDRIYIATLLGVYYIDYSNNYPNFKQIENIKSSAWTLLKIKNNEEEKLYVGTAIDIYEIKDIKAIPLNLKGFETYKLIASKKDPSVFYLGYILGFVKFSVEGNQWKIIKKYPEIKDEIRSIQEDKFGNIWLGTAINGIIMISPDDKIKKFGLNDGLPAANQIYIYFSDGEILIATPKGLCTYDYPKDKIIPYTKFGNSFTNKSKGVLCFVEDSNGKKWLSCMAKNKEWIETIEVNKDGSYKIDSLTLKRIPTMSFQSIYTENNGITWIGGTQGLYTFNTNFNKNYKPPYYTLLRSVIIGEDSLIFGGTNYSNKNSNDSINPEIIKIAVNQPNELKPVLNWANNSIKFSFSSTFFEDEPSTTYSYYLEGYQNNWSKWSNKNEAIYTNLWNGKYKFHVKARNIFGHESQTATYEFEILPPWYRTTWAYIVYAILIILIVWGIVIIATLRIKRLNIAYGRYLPGSFLKLLDKRRVIDFRLGDMVEKEMTIMFSDIRSYTNLSESMIPQDNFRFLVKYLGLIGDMLHKNDGFPVQYYGDGIMAMFSGDTDNAIRASIDMHNKVAEYSKIRATKNRRTLQIGVGMHTGKIVMGIRGDARRWEGGIVGDSVNLAARMEGLTKIYGASTLVSDDLYNKLKNPSKFNIRFLGKVKVKGKDLPVGIYEVLDGLPADIFQIKMSTKKDFDSALSLYFEKQFEPSISLFKKVVEQNPNDITAKHYIEIIEHLQIDGIPEDWDGVEKLDKK